jgi:hypothetical protein
VWCLYKWLKDDAYGINNTDSLIFMGCLYAARARHLRRSRLYAAAQGMDLSMAYGEIPAE